MALGLVALGLVALGLLPPSLVALSLVGVGSLRQLAVTLSFFLRKLKKDFFFLALALRSVQEPVSEAEHDSSTSERAACEGEALIRGARDKILGASEIFEWIAESLLEVGRFAVWMVGLSGREQPVS